MLFVYSNAYQSGWVLDNRPIVHDDARVHEASWENIRLIFTKDYWYPKHDSGLYRPLTTLSYLGNSLIASGREATASYHLVNNLLHALNAWLLFVLCRRLSGRTWPAMAAALIFATHPIATEAVTNIVGRADLLAMAALLSGLLAYIRATELSSTTARNPWLFRLLIITIAGLLSKESAAALIGLALLYDIVTAKTWSVAELRTRVTGWWTHGFFVFALAGVAVAGIRFWVLSGTIPSEPFVDNPLRGSGFLDSRLTAIEVFGKQLSRLVWPAHLSTEYTFNQIPVVGWPPSGGALAVVVVTLIALAVTCWVAFRGRRTHAAVAFFLLWVPIAYLPTSNFLVTIGSIMAERFMYLPLAGFAAVAAFAIDAVAIRIAPSRARLAGSLLLAVACVWLGARTWVRNGDWRDDLTLARAAVRESPDSFSAHEHLAAAIFEANPGDIISAVAEAGRSVAILAPLPAAESDAEPFVRLATYQAAMSDRPSLATSASDAAERRAWLNQAEQTLLRARIIDRAGNDAHRARGLHAGLSGDRILDTGMTALYDLLSIVELRLGHDAAAREAADWSKHLQEANARQANPR